MALGSSQKGRLIRAERDGPGGFSVRQRLAGVIHRHKRYEGPLVESQKVHVEVVAKQPLPSARLQFWSDEPIEFALL